MTNNSKYPLTKLAGKKTNRPFNAKLNEDKVRAIKEMIRVGYSIADIALKYDVVQTTIHRIKQNQTWKDVK